MHRSTRLFALLAVVLIASQASADWIRLGSWNIEHLGKYEDEVTGPKAVAEAIHLSGVDILAMQEIYDNDDVSGTKTNTQLSAAFAVLDQIPGHTWKYEMLPNKSTGDKSQLVTIAWNEDRVQKVGDAFRIPVDRQQHEWDRHPHAIKFTAGAGKTDIVVIPLHMKADYNGDYSAQRGLEARELADQMGLVRTELGDEDIVLIGDLNCDEADEPALQVFAGAGFKDLNADDVATHIRWGPLDRVLVPRQQQEFVFSRQYVLTATDTEAFDKYLSDHQIILTPIRVLDDDD